MVKMVNVTPLALSHVCNINTKLFYCTIKPITNIKKLHGTASGMLQISRYEADQYDVFKKVILINGLTLINFLSMFPLS